MFNWGVIGTGNIAKTVCRKITKSGRHKVVAVYSRTLEKAQRFADKFGAKCYADEEDFFADKDIDAVYIATPHSVHYYYLLQCVKHKIPVLTEKPFTVNGDQAKAVYDAAEKENVFVCEAMWTRFLPVVRKVAEWVSQGKIGEVQSFEGSFSMPLQIIKPFTPERVYKAEYAGGALLDLGVYPIAFSEMVLGMPDKIVCDQTIENGVDYEDRISLFYKNGVSRLYSSFTGLTSFKGTVFGTKGRIDIPNFSRPVKAVLHNDNGKEVFRGKRSYVFEFDQCAEDIRNGLSESSVMKKENTLNVMKILDECRKQNNLKYPGKAEEV